MQVSVHGAVRDGQPSSSQLLRLQPTQRRPQTNCRPTLQHVVPDGLCVRALALRLALLRALWRRLRARLHTLLATLLPHLATSTIVLLFSLHRFHFSCKRHRQQKERKQKGTAWHRDHVFGRRGESFVTLPAQLYTNTTGTTQVVDVLEYRKCCPSLPYRYR